MAYSHTLGDFVDVLQPDTSLFLLLAELFLEQGIISNDADALMQKGRFYGFRVVAFLVDDVVEDDLGLLIGLGLSFWRIIWGACNLYHTTI